MSSSTHSQNAISSTEVTEAKQETMPTTNKNDSTLVCQICQSTVLLKNAANSWYDGEYDLPMARQQKGVETQKETVKGFWGVIDMFSFENIGFTHSVDGIKFLTCADCEYGPIGFVDKASKIHYITPTRLAEEK